MTPRSTKNNISKIWVEKNSVGALVTYAQNAYYRNLKRTFEDLLPCYCYAIKTENTTIH